jgi:hypothetical protein
VYLRCWSLLQVWICFPNEVQIFIVKHVLVFLALGSPSLALFATPSSALFFIFLLVYDEAFANLK